MLSNKNKGTNNHRGCFVRINTENSSTLVLGTGHLVDEYASLIPTCWLVVLPQCSLEPIIYSALTKLLVAGEDERLDPHTIQWIFGRFGACVRGRTAEGYVTLSRPVKRLASGHGRRSGGARELYATVYSRCATQARAHLSKSVSTVRTLFIDETSPVPHWVQIKEQIKVAYTVGGLRGGDVLPSIRSLAQQLGVGDAVVRRAYRELTELGLLSSKHRQHVTVTEDLVKPPHLERQVAESNLECDRMIQWASEKGMSPLSLARLFLRRVAAIESSSPSYAYVDQSSRSARRGAGLIAKAWEIQIAALSLDDIRFLPRAKLARYTALIVNSYRHEKLIAIPGVDKQRVFRVRVDWDRSLLDKLRTLGVGAKVRLVLSDEDYSNFGTTARDYLVDFVGKQLEIESVPWSRFSEILDEEKELGFIIVSLHLWDNMPERARVLDKVIRANTTFDTDSLEAVRVPAGVLI